MSWEKLKHLTGFLLFVGAFGSAFALHGDTARYLNATGLLIVFGGTFAALFVAYRPEQLRITLRVLRSSYRYGEKHAEDIVRILVDLSVKSRMQGLLSLQEDEEETTVLFLRDALGMLVDGYPPERIREILDTEMLFFRERRERSERVLRTGAQLSPAFGLVGTVVGLISMLHGIGDTTIILQTVPIALVSTLYGVVLSNLFLTPFAVKVHARTEAELLLKELIADATLAIQAELPPRQLERQLQAFLTPAQRRRQPVSYAKLRARFRIPSQPPPDGRSRDRQAAAGATAASAPAPAASAPQSSGQTARKARSSNQ